MPQKVLRFSGINRRINEFNGSGACEEMINLRPEAQGGYRAIKNKQRHKLVESLKCIYEHKFGDVSNLIQFAAGWVNWYDGFIVRGITDEFKGMDDVTFSSAGNVLVIYSAKNKKQLVYKFENNSYEKYKVIFPRINSVTIGSGSAKSYSIKADENSSGAMNAAMLKAASSFGERYTNGACGMIVVGCTYELESGEEVWSTAFAIADISSAPTVDSSNLTVTVTGSTNTRVSLSLDTTSSKGVKKINIYASLPVMPYEIQGGRIDENHATTSYYAERLSVDEINIGGQMMYFQGSVSPSKSSSSFKLDYGLEKTGDMLMPVTAGCIERIGKSISYNNRFHCFDSSVEHVIQAPFVAKELGPRDTGDYWRAYIKYDGKWYRTRHRFKMYFGSENHFAYPMAGVTKMAFVQTPEGDIYFRDNEMFYVDMQDSSAYNYSYAIDITPSKIAAADFYDSLLASGGSVTGYDEKIFLKDETNAINVSSQYNPFVFPVEYSYSFGGEVVDVVTSYLPISSTQVGQYPLTVFTTNGIYALEQGDGSVLYSNTTPLSPMVLTGKAVSTPYGVFFVSSKGLYLLLGRETSNVSYVLDGEVEENIKETDAYNKLCCNKKGIFYDFSKALTNEDFESFISDATLTYDQLQNELYISSNNADILYSYVFNLDTKSFHKVSKKLYNGQNGARYAIELKEDMMEGYKDIVDLYSEVHSTEQHILLQSRPMQLEELSTHIQRMILKVDAKLSSDKQNLCFSVFGSDNLYDWKCIISAQKQNTVLRHIRTNKAAKSYKDYIILITGTVDTHTDLSDIIADYAVVNRRLG